FHRTPANGLSVEVGHQAAGGAGPRVTTVGLFAQQRGPLCFWHRAPIAALELEPLAGAVGGHAPLTEDHLEVRPAGLVGWDHDQASTWRDWNHGLRVPPQPGLIPSPNPPAGRARSTCPGSRR